MLHPMLRLALARPDLLADHASAYAELAAVSAREVVADWQLRLIGWGLLVAGVLLCITFGGIAIMLHSTVAAAPMPLPLWVVPAAPALLALLGGWLARRRTHASRAKSITQQFEADLALLRART